MTNYKCNNSKNYNNYIYNDINIQNSKNNIVKFKNNNNPYKINLKEDNEKFPLLIYHNIDNFIKIIVFKCNEILKTKNIFDTIDFKEYNFDDITNKNVLEALKFIENNPRLKNEMILEKLNSYIKLLLKDFTNNEINKLLDMINKEINKIKYNPFNISLKENDKEDYLNLMKIYIDSLKPNDKLLLDTIKNTDSTSTFEDIYGSILYSKKKISFSSNNKLILNKCYNKKKIDDLIKLKFDYKIHDLNGNTIINRLIDQYNVYGIEQILKELPILKTYQNFKNETPTEYLFNIINNIKDYYSNEKFNTRMNNYFEILKKMINENFSNISLEDNIVSNLITYSIYMFNELIWLKSLNYPNGWTNDNKEKLKSIFNFKEILLIKTFDDECIKLIKEDQTNNIDTRIKNMTDELENEIKNIENTIEQLKLEKKNNLLNNNIFSNYNSDLNKKKQELNNLNSTKLSNANINELNIKLAQLKKDITNFKIDHNINWQEYNNKIKKFKSWYYKIIKALVSKDNDVLVCKSQLSLLAYDYKKSNNNEIDILNEYYDKIINNFYADYMDLDIYEDSEYNEISYGIINIMRINIINVLIHEMISGIVNYFLTKYNDKNDIIKKFENNNEYKTIVESIDKLLNEKMIEKLNLKNPNKTYSVIDIQNNIINIFYKTFNIKDNDNDNLELKNIINFYVFICENISLICYEEINKLFTDLKKMSIYIKILKLLQ